MAELQDPSSYLKACPFCGWHPDWAFEGDRNSIYCPNQNCIGACATGETKGETIRAWQRRAVPSLHDFTKPYAANVFNEAFHKARAEDGKKSRDAVRDGLTAVYHWASKVCRVVAPEEPT